MRKTLLLILSFFIACLVSAQNWDYIQTSGEYYYGVGHGKTVAEAGEMAMAELVNMISVNVTTEFVGLTDETNRNGEIDFKSKIHECIQSYSQTTLTNVEKWVIGKEPDVTVRRYMKRSELEKIFEERIIKAKDMLTIAAEAKDRGKVDMALQYYYWSYTLIRSVQHPNEVKDEAGRVLVNWIPLEIEDILSKVKIEYDQREGDFVDLKISYDGKPVSSMEYTYSDGRAECQGSAKDGCGVIEMAPGYNTDVYHINVEYQYKGQARGDAEMLSVLNVVPRKMFRYAEQTVEGKPCEGKNEALPVQNRIAQTVQQPKNESLTVADYQKYSEKIDRVLQGIMTKNNMGMASLFTLDGLEIYNELIAYGKGRIVGKPQIRFYKGANGTVVARGLQMSFSFRNGRKKTFVEDVVFTFNDKGKIDCIAFGLGKTATDDILNRYAPGWSNETREMLVEFMENYKTAYSLKRLDYIRSIFADDAVIIVGNVAKRYVGNQTDGPKVSVDGVQKISYNRYDKDTYLKRLETCFKRNEFINIKFSHNEVQRLEKYEDEDLYAIQIGQEYASSSYSDKGYLFLLVDMTKRESPLIRIRTWQPNEVSMEKLYNAGDFYDE